MKRLALIVSSLLVSCSPRYEVYLYKQHTSKGVLATFGSSYFLEAAQHNCELFLEAYLSYHPEEGGVGYICTDFKFE